MAKDSKQPKKSNPAAQLDADVQVLEQQVTELTKALQREGADATNVRRRAEEDRIKMAGYHKAAVVRALLPIIDNFERALKHIPAELTDNDYIKGVQGVVKQFDKTLSDLGVQKIKTVNEVFDPRFHEAIQMEDGDGSQEVVSEELQSGYILGEEVIRHAMVKVRMQ